MKVGTCHWPRCGHTTFRFGCRQEAICGSSSLRLATSKPGIGAAMFPVYGPPLWESCDAQMDDGMQIEPDGELAAQPASSYEVDQRINW